MREGKWRKLFSKGLQALGSQPDVWFGFDATLARARLGLSISCLREGVRTNVSGRGGGHFDSWVVKRVDVRTSRVVIRRSIQAGNLPT